MISAIPNASDIINYSGTASATGVVTVPGGRWLTADVQLSATVAGVAASSNPVVTYKIPGGTSGAAPANNSVLARVNATSLLATSTATSSMTEILVYGGDNGCTLDFTAGANGTSSVTINGFLL